MFHGCDEFDANLETWDVTKVKEMSGMFSNTISYTGLGIDQWDVSFVNEMQGMFANSIKFNGNLSTWDVLNVIQMNSLFYQATAYMGVGLENWNVSNTTITTDMFCGTSNLTQSRELAWAPIDVFCQS